MSNKIKHAGVVDGVEGECVRVRILQSSACSACKVAAHCNASETKEKIIDVMDADASHYQKGDRVMVVADTAVGYLLPLILMVVTLVGVLAATHSEGLAAVSALGILMPYYVLLFLMRNKLRNRLSFSLER